MKMPDLKPCPFCGSPALIKTSPHFPNGMEYTVRCSVKSCAGRSYKSWVNIDDAVNAWNRRVTGENV